MGGPPKLWDLKRPELTSLSLQEVPPEIMPLVIDEYLDKGSDAPAMRYAFQELVGDVVFVIPTLIFSKHLQGKPALATCPVLPALSGDAAAADWYRIPGCLASHICCHLPALFL